MIIEIRHTCAEKVCVFGTLKSEVAYRTVAMSVEQKTGAVALVIVPDQGPVHPDTILPETWAIELVEVLMGNILTAYHRPFPNDLPRGSHGG